MIDHNKYVHQETKNTSSTRASFTRRPHYKKKIKLTKDNKAFLKAIGLLK